MKLLVSDGHEAAESRRAVREGRRSGGRRRAFAIFAG